MTDWKVGDLAVCVDAGPMINNFNIVMTAKELVEGAVYSVCKIGREGDLFLAEAIAPNEPYWGFIEHRFRKVQHDKPEACEEEFVTLLNRSKRKVGA